MLLMCAFPLKAFDGGNVRFSDIRTSIFFFSDMNASSFGIDLFILSRISLAKSPSPQRTTGPPCREIPFAPLAALRETRSCDREKEPGQAA
jgi:hypothetical protein